MLSIAINGVTCVDNAPCDLNPEVGTVTTQYSSPAIPATPSTPAVPSAYSVFVSASADSDNVDTNFSVQSSSPVGDGGTIHIVARADGLSGDSGHSAMGGSQSNSASVSGSTNGTGQGAFTEAAYHDETNFIITNGVIEQKVDVTIGRDSHSGGDLAATFVAPPVTCTPPLLPPDCTPPHPQVCTPPQTGIYPNCGTCSDNQTGTYPACVPKVCTPPQTGTYPDCGVCPITSTGTYPACRPIVCTPPTVGTYPDCRVPTCADTSQLGTWPNCYNAPTCADSGRVGTYPQCVDACTLTNSCQQQPGTPPVSMPTLSEWSLIGLIVILALVAGRQLWKRKGK